MVKIIFGLILIATVVEAYILFSGVMVKNEKMITAEISVVSPTIIITNTPSPIPTTIQITPKVGNEELKKIVEKVLDGSDGTYGVVIKNLKTGQEYVLNGDREFHPASLYKLWIMATVYQQFQNGQLDKREILSQDISILNSKFDIDPTSAEQTEGTSTMMVEEALEKMITRSDNYAALLLSERLKLSTVLKFLINNKLMNSKLGQPPVSSSNDIALFLEKLYKGELADQKKSQEMIELLKRQQLNTKLPKLLKKDIEIAHKTGELESYSHDAGIVFSKEGDYIIVVMSETDNRNNANNVIAQVSKEVFEYFNN